ncbi:MAG: leucine-rich repeat domain-containing protein, partial [Treponema sp.]|nr:leucine-rich repeat domain-containing protein [Treponema sp.]
TFTGVAEDSFTYSGAAGVTNPAGQGSGLTVTITFPKTSGGEKITITSTEGLAVLLAGHAGGNSADEPVEAAAALELSEANWSALLNEINRGRKYVSLDLAACASSDNNSLGGLRPIGDFDPMPSISTGKAYIVNLTLPVQASGIVAGASETPTFSNFSALKTVSGEEVRTIGDSAFRDCDALTSVSLPAAETIGDSAFRGCGALTSVSLPAAESIGYSAFSGCDALTSVTMPATLYQEAFNNASFGGKIVWTLVERDGFIGPWSTLENGKLLVHYTTMLVYGRAASGSITLPASITSIGNRAFSGCDALTSVSLPAVVTIGDRAFDGCDALASVSLPAAESIGYSAFSGCGTLASVSLPAAESIGYSAFSGCSALASVSLPAAESIGYSAFYGCGTLSSVSLPAAKTIDYRAFSGCGALASVSLPAAETIGDSAFRDCGALASVSLPAAESIDYRAFSGCGALTSVTLGATRPSLGSDILSNVSGTITVGIPSGSETAYGVSGYNNGDSAANNWGNAFRGRGSTSGYGTVNTSVSLVFETY